MTQQPYIYTSIQLVTLYNSKIHLFLFEEKLDQIFAKFL